MITLADIQLKAERAYLPFLQSWVRGESYAPLRFPAGKLPTDFPQLRAAVQQLQITAKEQKGYGYTIEIRQQQTRLLGVQTVPTAVVFETAADFLRFIAKEQEFQFFQQDVAYIREQLPQLTTWIERFPRKVLAQHGIWPDLMAVCRYFLDHPQSDLYLRALPIGVHTKFIETHRGIVRELLEELLPIEGTTPQPRTFQQRFGLREEESFVSVRFLDGQLFARYGVPLDELGTPCSQFARLDFRDQRYIITENKMNFLTLPRLPETIAILGGGSGVSILASISWLKECSLIYWGDIDAHGFQILSQLRSIFPHVFSLMMNEETLNAFAHFQVEGTPYSVRQLPHLTPEEHTLFVYLAEHNIRLEQEHISHTYALEKLRDVFDVC